MWRSFLDFRDAFLMGQTGRVGGRMGGIDVSDRFCVGRAKPSNKFRCFHHPKFRK